MNGVHFQGQLSRNCSVMLSKELVELAIFMPSSMSSLFEQQQGISFTLRKVKPVLIPVLIITVKERMILHDISGHCAYVTVYIRPT